MRVNPPPIGACSRVRNFRISEQHHGTAGERTYRFEPTYTFRSLSDLYIEFDPI